MSNTTKLAIALALTVTATGALAQTRSRAPVYGGYASVPDTGYVSPRSPYYWSSDEESRLDHARGYIGGY
jgi:hypothetical protein